MKSKRLLLMLLMALLVPWAANAQGTETLTLLDENFDAMSSSSISTGYSGGNWYAYNAGSGNNWTLNTSSSYANSGSNSVQYNYHSSYAANCYLVSAPFTVSSTMTKLEVKLFERVRSSSYPEIFEVFFVKASDLTDGASITTATHYDAIASASYTNTSYAQVTGSVTNSALAGTSVRVVVHCTSAADKYTLYIDDIKVEQTYVNNCPWPTDFVASNVTGHTAVLTWETEATAIQLQYKKATDENWQTADIETGTTCTLNLLDPETQYQARVAAHSESCGVDPETGNPIYSDWATVDFTTLVACPAPTNLAVTPESITAHEATVTWEGTSESYVVSLGVYDFTATPTVINVEERFENGMPTGWTHIGSGSGAPANSNPHNGSYSLKFDGATSNNVVVLPEFEVEANTLTIDFWSKAESSTISNSGYFDLGYVTDATNASTFVALETYSASQHGSYTHVENYSMAAAPAGARIAFRHRSGVTYYYWFIDDVTINGVVYPINWIDYNTTNQTYPFVNLTPNRPYQVKVKGNCGSEGYSAEAGPISFTTLESCFAPTGLAMVAGYPTAHGASFTWDYQTGEVFQFALVQGNVTDPSEVNFNTTWNAGDNFPMWNTLSADTDWSFFLRKNCDGDFSDPVYVNFHTLEACPAPTGFAVMPNSITAHTANLTWQGTSNSYQVAYRTTAYTDGTEETFDNNSIPTGWTKYIGLLSDVMGGTALSSTTSGWSFGTKNNVFNSHSYLNIWSTSTKYWLVSPQTEVPNGAVCSFDLALTVWSSLTAVDPTSQLDDKFVVLISTDDMATWTILRQWDNDANTTGDIYAVYNDIACSATGEKVNIDLSAYAGENVYIAFYGESTQTGGDNALHIDNVAIGTPVEAGEWQYMTEVTEVPCQLTGLLAERKYEATLQGDCGNEGSSTVVGPITFKTAISCPAPTALNHANVKSNQADLSWTTGGAEDWVLAYKKTDDANFTEVNLGIADVTIEGTTVTYTLTGLDETTDYTVKVRDNCEASIPGDGMSAWTATTSFTTMAACSVDNVTVSNISHYAATINWDGESNKGFTVKYREAERIDGLNEEFGTSTPEGWSLYTGKLTASGDSYTATLSSYSNWSFGTWSFTDGTTNTPVLTGNHARVNIYGNSQKWLVTPKLTVNSNTLSFDMALTSYYSNTNDHPEPDYTGTDDKFMVLVSTDNMATWNILREWNNEDGAQYVYNNINHTATGESVSISMSNYVGQEVYIAFYGESTTSNADNYIHIDNVIVGVTVPAGSWQENDTNESPYIISGLEPGTKYDLKVAPICDETLVSEIQQFTTASPNDKWFITEGNWGTAANWEPAGVPTIEQTVELRANATIESGCVAEAKSITGTGTSESSKTLTIEDGGQLKHNSSGVRATVKKNITGYGAENINTKDGYYFISNPLTTTLSTTSTPTIASTGILTGTFDFYNWSSSNQGAEWRNYEATGGTFNMTTGLYGYLYANENDVELTYTGTIRQSNSYQSRYLYDYSGNYDFGGYWLIGNPFVCDAYLVNASTNGTALPYYKMNAEGNDYEAVTGGAIAPMEGVFYDVTEDGGNTGTANVYMVRTAPAEQRGGTLSMMVSEGRSIRDNAIIRFDGGQQLSKMSFRENSTKIYMPVEGKDFAIVSAGNVGEMPVNFKAEKNGSYTLSFTSKEVSLSYLHLIDNMTGADVDLLANPSYSFSAQTTDYASRFRLVFATGSSVDGDSFAFINGMGNLCIFGIEGEATVQVMDALGRMVSSNTFSGSFESKLNVAPGVYMIRLINGNDVKVQKIVVK